MKRFNIRLCFTGLLLFAVGWVDIYAQAPPKAPIPDTIYLDQGWTDKEREEFYFSPQGSQLIPYEWFLELETKAGHTRFRDNSNLDRLRFVTRAPSDDWNPDGLPVGFVQDTDIDPTQTSSKIAYLERAFGTKAKVDDQNRWLGLTCAACHTSRIEHNGASLQIDGGPSMADLQTFLIELAEALDATHKDEPKLKRFARALKREDIGALQMEVAEHSLALKSLVKRNQSKYPYGFARLDAFGAIFNSVCDAALEIPGNRVESNAPVSYPFLWETSRMDWVQWNNSANIAVARNVGEVLGVFGFFTLKSSDGTKQQFDSTVRLKQLIKLETQISKLKAPAWPEDLLGVLDREKVLQGKALFSANCAACHQLRNANGQFRMVNMAGEQRIKSHTSRLADIKTDPQMILNLRPTADPGVLKALLPPELANLPRVPRSELLKLAVRGVTLHRAQKEMIPIVPNPAMTALEAPHGGAGYAARPLEGIWATAPFLHNGSVPNLYELLLPSEQRSKSFFVGSRKFDPKRVGFTTESSPGAFEFNVTAAGQAIPGNSNVGHEGHGAGQDEGYTETFENGSWREFTEAERYALVEFMKSLAPTGEKGVAVDLPTEKGDSTAIVEQIPPEEPRQITSIVAMTVQQLKNRYSGEAQVLRGVHPKDHGCVRAVFEIAADLDESYRVGVFAEPGRRYDSWVRFSNAAAILQPDDPKDRKADGTEGPPVPGSRGMAIKLMGVEGTPLVPPDGPLTQDFLMVNHPVFAFANVADYEVLSSILADPQNMESPKRFFDEQFAKGGAAKERAVRTAEIVGRIRAPNEAAGAFQPQPASPVDCRYFSGAPFRFGTQYVMKYSAVPVDAALNAPPDVADPNYLRNALVKRLADHSGATPVVFKFQVQRRRVSGLDISQDIENACTEWPEKTFGFVTVATLTIPPQAFDSPERRRLCEDLFFTPWHGIDEHQPLGGINRMRRAVYEASSEFRHQPKKPATP